MDAITPLPQLWTAILLCSALAGCGTPELPVDEPARSCSHAIVSGTRDDTAPYRYPFTGAVHTTERDENGRQLEGMCTATLLSCGAAITAAHCVAAEGREVATSGPIDTSSFASPYGIVDAPYNARYHRIHLHPGYQPILRGESPSDNAIARDVAILELTYDDTSASKAQILAHKRSMLQLEWPRLGDQASLQAGMIAWAVGFGSSQSVDGTCVHEPDEIEPCDGAFCQPATFEHRRFASAWVEQIGPEAMLSPVTIAAGDACGMTAPGDSGGPLFLEDGRTLVAIASATNATPQRACSASRAWFANLTTPETASWIAGVLEGMDRDHDGIPDACDPCPQSADHRDSDGDGTPDACESKPWAHRGCSRAGSMKPWP